MTESGIRFSLERAAPGKRFHFVANEKCNCSECPYMKLNTLEKLRDCLLELEPRVELADRNHAARAGAARAHARGAGSACRPNPGRFLRPGSR